jgi:hypothetical protein
MHHLALYRPRHLRRAYNSRQTGSARVGAKSKNKAFSLAMLRQGNDILLESCRDLCIYVSYNLRDPHRARPLSRNRTGTRAPGHCELPHTPRRRRHGSAYVGSALSSGGRTGWAGAESLRQLPFMTPPAHDFARSIGIARPHPACAFPSAADLLRCTLQGRSRRRGGALFTRPVPAECAIRALSARSRSCWSSSTCRGGNHPFG